MPHIYRARYNFGKTEGGRGRQVGREEGVEGAKTESGPSPLRLLAVKTRYTAAPMARPVTWLVGRCLSAIGTHPLAKKMPAHKTKSSGKEESGVKKDLF